MSSCLPPLTFLTWGIRCASQAPWSVWSLSTSIEVTWTAWIRTPIGFWWFGNKNHGFDAKKLDVYPVKFSRWPWYLQKICFSMWGVDRNMFQEMAMVFWCSIRGLSFDGYPQDLATGRSCTAGWISLLSKQRSSQVVGKPSKVTIHGCMYKWQVGSITT